LICLGTLQYMAPEVIDKGIRGYGPAVCKLTELYLGALDCL